MAKKNQTNQLRLEGVVRAMNTAREQLSAGIPANEVDSFRKWVRGVIHQVDQLCKLRNTRPERLPAPTYRAYQFLKSIDLNNLPVRKGTAPIPAKPAPTPKALHINNLVAMRDRVQMKIDSLTIEAINRGEAIPERERAALHKQIQEVAAGVDSIFVENNKDASDLPDRSRRVYQWFKYLSEPENLALHLDAVRRITQMTAVSECRKRAPAAQQGIRLYASFAHSASLYRARVEGDGIHLTASEAFIHAPDETLEALGCVAIVGKISPHIDTLNRYVDSDEFGEALLALEMIGMPAMNTARGRTYDLNQVFDRVNAAYFEGKLPRPRLTWNRTLTYRKLGHYQPATDTVLISISLDQPEIPDYVIDYVMYHELLHKRLGAQVINGRRYVHTPAFRQEERKFARYEEAEAFLKEIGKRDI